MSAGDFITRGEFERERRDTRDRLAKVETRQNEHAAELKQLKELILTGFHEVRADLGNVRVDMQEVKSLKRRFVEGMAAGAGVSYALYQAIHAALTVHP